MDILIDVFGFTNSGSKVKIGQIAKRLYSIGGTIFYVNSNATGASYSFFDSNGNEIATDDTDLTTFANAVYYTKSGTASADRYYVYESTTGKINSKPWGYDSITTGAYGTGIGDGKTNTNTILAITDTSASASSSIFAYITDMRNNETNGCNDWYVGSDNELLQLASSGTAGASYSTYGSWSSCEDSSSSAHRKGYQANFLTSNKTTAYESSFIPLRSF